MSMVSNMSVRGKLVSAFFSIIILTVIISAISLIQLFKTNDVIKYVHFILGTRYEAVSKIYYSMLDVEAVCFELQGNLQALNAEKEAVLNDLKERLERMLPWNLMKNQGDLNEQLIRVLKNKPLGMYWR